MKGSWPLNAGAAQIEKAIAVSGSSALPMGQRGSRCAQRGGGTVGRRARRGGAAAMATPNGSSNE